MSSPAVVLITGASRGLGRGVALQCATAGYSVAIHFAGNREAAEETKKLCEARATASGQSFAIVQGNLGVTADLAKIVQHTLDTFGHCDALINNAGMAPRERNDIVNATETSYDEVMGVNLKGPYFLSQAVARYWLANKEKSRLPGGYKLVFVTSISADTASVNRGEYCLSKAGLAMATQLWATRLANENAQVFEVRPGIMQTDMTAGVKGKYDDLIANGLVPQKRWGQPEDVGLAIEAILKGSFPFTTGQVISVDGGFHLRRL
jgi:3-oxoacyl-[acyl-carrier protein] reductase